VILSFFEYFISNDVTIQQKFSTTQSRI